jgi:hypothetical protein
VLDEEKSKIKGIQTISIFQLDGSASISNEKKMIELEMNPKEPKLMGKLNNGLSILNTMNVYDLDDRLIKFKS